MKSPYSVRFSLWVSFWLPAADFPDFQYQNGPEISSASNGRGPRAWIIQVMPDLLENPSKIIFENIFSCFQAHIRPFSAFLGANSMKLRFGCNGIGLGVKKITKKF